MKRPIVLAMLSTLSVAGVAADLHAVVRSDKGEPVRDAVIVAVPDVAPPKPQRPKLEQVEQIGEEFVPKVKAILVGSPVSFPNRDSVRHHVYSFSPAKRFDLPLYVGTPAKPVVFDTPGVVVLGCNIHDWMIGYIYVSESPYYATTGNDGEALISGLPAGDYTVRIWHPQLADVVENTRRKLEANETADMLWRVPLKPEVRIRRAPTSTRRGPY
ncbi:MAG TPA: methylamine utilization protein [Burkholderiales bacterium]|nr:methylamine utilization protein [Burkholderiales bacterium]